MTKISPNNNLSAAKPEKAIKANADSAAFPLKVGEVVRRAVRCLLTCLVFPLKLVTKTTDANQSPKKELQDEDLVQIDGIDKTTLARSISVKEAAALSSFPVSDTFDVPAPQYRGPTEHEIAVLQSYEQRKQIGNAVPIRLATAIAHSVRDVLEFEYVGEPKPNASPP